MKWYAKKCYFSIENRVNTTIGLLPHPSFHNWLTRNLPSVKTLVRIARSTYICTSTCPISVMHSRLRTMTRTRHAGRLICIYYHFLQPLPPSVAVRPPPPCFFLVCASVRVCMHGAYVQCECEGVTSVQTRSHHS